DRQGAKWIWRRAESSDATTLRRQACHDCQTQLAGILEPGNRVGVLQIEYGRPCHKVAHEQVEPAVAVSAGQPLSISTTSAPTMMPVERRRAAAQRASAQLHSNVMSSETGGTLESVATTRIPYCRWLLSALATVPPIVAKTQLEQLPASAFVVLPSRACT